MTLEVFINSHLELLDKTNVTTSLQWVRANEDHVPSTAYMVKGLQSDIEYEFRVTAENKAGTGPP